MLNLIDKLLSLPHCSFGEEMTNKSDLKSD